MDWDLPIITEGFIEVGYKKIEGNSSWAAQSD